MLTKSGTKPGSIHHTWSESHGVGSTAPPASPGSASAPSWPPLCHLCRRLSLTSLSERLTCIFNPFSMQHGCERCQHTATLKVGCIFYIKFVSKPLSGTEQAPFYPDGWGAGGLTWGLWFFLALKIIDAQYKPSHASWKELTSCDKVSQEILFLATII